MLINTRGDSLCRESCYMNKQVSSYSWNTGIYNTDEVHGNYLVLLPGMWSNTYLYLQILKNWYLYLYLYLRILKVAYLYLKLVFASNTVKYNILIWWELLICHTQNFSHYCTVILFFFFNNSWQPCIDFFKILLSRVSRDTNVLVWSCSSLLAKMELLLK